MVSIYQSLMAASVIVGLISIPAASNTLDAQGGFEANLSQISTNEVPENVVEEASSDRFYRSEESAFGEFTTEIESDSSKVLLEDPSARLEVEEGPGKKVWTLSTPEAQMEQVQSPEQTKEIYEMSEGTLEKVEENGEVRKEFEGSDREEVEQKADELRDLMEKKLEEVKKRSEKLREKAMPEFRLEVNAEEEFVEIQNLQEREIDLEGWKIKDNTSNSYEFGDVSVGPEETLTFYTHEGEDSDTEVYWGYSDGYSVWSQSGDVATLYNDAGELIAEKSY